MTSTAAPRTRRAARTVSRPHDPAERQADRAADVVARGGSVGGWSFGAVPISAGVHRDGPEPTPKDEEDKRQAELEQAAKDAALTDSDKAIKGIGKVAEGISKTPTGKQAIQLVRERPDVASVEKFLGTPAGKIAIGGVAAAGLTGLAIAKQPVPFSIPAIPLSPTLSLKPQISGPVNAPTGIMITLSYRGVSAGSTKDPNSKEAVAADIARIQKDNAWLTDAVQRARDAEGAGTAAPVQRAAATATDAAPPRSTDRVDDAVSSAGRPLDPAVRHSMEARFRADFSSVRLHDGARSTEAAADLDATAFTVGDDIVFSGSAPDAATYEGRHLLAHELAHVVQQRSAPRGGGWVPLVHRRSVGEWIGIFFGTAEGNWTDKELRSYLRDITAKGKIDGAFDADNKARAIVRKWKAATPGWELSGRQKGLLIDEMIDGPTLDDDEKAILDLLELSDAGDLRTIFHEPQKRVKDLDDDFHGGEYERLKGFLSSRFAGGAKALAKGEVDVIGDVVPRGAPSFAFDMQRLVARFDADDTADDIIGVIEALSPADRQRALTHLLHVTWPATAIERGKARVALAKATDEAKEPLTERIDVLKAKLHRLKSVLTYFFLADIPATRKELRASTKPVTAADAQAVQDVLKPEQFEAAAKEPEEPEEAPEPKPAKTDAAESSTEAPPKRKSAAAQKKEAAEKKAAEKKKKEAEKKRKLAAEEKRLGTSSKYRTALQKVLGDLIEKRYQRHVVQVGRHADKGIIEAMAPHAKKQTDAVFGAFYDADKHPAMTFGSKDRPGNLHSWFDTFSAELKDMTDAQLHREAKAWARYYCQAAADIRVLNDQYDAEPLFDEDELPQNIAARTQIAVIDDLTKDGPSKDGIDDPTTIVDKLNATQRNWPGMARGTDVFVDLYLSSDKTKNRRRRWGMLQTLIHEYIHTLVDQDSYEKYASSFGSTSVQWNTLIEGVDEVFAGMVWQHLAPQADEEKLRIAVEGKAAAKLPALKIPAPGHYESFDEAMRLVQLVGIRNLMAAYFLGAVDRIRGPEKKGKK